METVDVPFQNYPIVSMGGIIPDEIPAIAVAAAIVVTITESKRFTIKNGEKCSKGHWGN